MKKIFLFLFASAFAAQFCNAQWLPAAGGGPIYYNSGYVGILTNNPLSNLQLGILTGNQTTTPITLSLGGTYSNIPGITAKLKLWDDGSDNNIYGFGISSLQLDAIVPAGANFAWYVAGGQKMILNTNGNVGIGTANPDQMLTVNGTVHSKQVIVDANIPVPDYVFEPNYKLPDLTNLKNYLDQNHHLPEVPSANEIANNGVNLGNMEELLLMKVEELTLYLIEKDKSIIDQKKQLTSQQEQINQLKEQMAQLAKKIK